MKIFVQKIDNYLVPVYSSDHDEVKKLEPGVFYSAQITQDRNPGFHKKYWTLLKMVIDNLPDERKMLIPTTAKLHIELKVRLGYFDTYFLSTGDAVVTPRSISFEKMDNLEFKKFYRGVVDLILSDYLKGVTQEDLESLIMDFI